MKGRIGGLYENGQQVGGFLDWEFEMVFADGSDGIAKTYKFSKWKLTASSYWLFSAVNNVDVHLYHDTGTSYWEGSGLINSRLEQVFDTMIHQQIQILGEGQLNEH